MKVLELFSGTHSIGVVCDKLGGYDVVSLDRDLDAKSKLYDYESSHHIKEDIMTWNYKKDYKEGDFDIITASPVCLFWSALRNTWIGRESKTIKPEGGKVTKKDIENDINKYGKPMVDKVIEIIEFFKPNYYWIENPQTGKMKNYITEKYPEYDRFYDIDYCKYTDWGYKKKTRFWTNIEDYTPKLCNNDCDNIVIIDNQKLHKDRMGTSKTVNDNGKVIRVNTKALREKYRDYENIQNNKENTKIKSGVHSRYERYRVPFKLIEELLEKCN
jgi:hypothetical protein